MPPLIHDLGLDEHPVSPGRLLTECGYVHLYVGGVSEALACFEAAHLICPDEPGPMIGLGETALVQRRLEDAESLFARAVSLPGVDRETAAFAFVRLGDAALAARHAVDCRDAWTRSAAIGAGTSAGQVALERLRALDAAEDAGDSRGDPA